MSSSKPLLFRIAILAFVGIFILGCGFSFGTQPTEVPTSVPAEPSAPAKPTTPAEPTASTEPAAPDGQVTSVDDVKFATIQIEAQGTFVDPQVGTVYNAAGRGSGFIIDPSGLAITNNHVVTGAALLRVWVGGESEPRSARVLGVSECWDLAVIDIEGDGYPYLSFYEDAIQTNLDVYSAGFPLGDPEFTLTKGIVSKARADGDTNWASVPAVIEHDARIRPGNSGGPLVDENGQVVGINYAGNNTYDTNYAIVGQDAETVIEQLKTGDVEALGINGQAVVSEDGSISGIWVSSVESGSPADKTGLQGGDIITQVEGLIIATDGTMSDYCSILRTRSATDVLSIEVLRFATSEFLSGQINGDALETSYSFSSELSSDVASGTGSYAEYYTVTDDYSSIAMNVPTAWGEVDGSPWILDGEVIGASIIAAPSLTNYNSYWTEPGVEFTVSDDLAKLGGYIQVLDIYRDSLNDDCDYSGRYNYEDTVYEGAYDLFENCSGANNTVLMLSARPIVHKTSMLLAVMVNIMTEDDLAALDEILRTFDVVGNLP